jgi:hypothetical protein
MSHKLSSAEAQDLLGDRAKFKLCAAEHHLNNLRSFDQSDNIRIRTSEGRVPWEIEIESFLYHIIGVKDSLLVQINDKLQLKLKEREVGLRNVKMILNTIGKGALLADMKIFESGNDGWFSRVNKLRNQSTHRSLLNLKFSVTVGSSNEPKVYFVGGPADELEVIPFLEQIVKNMKDLIERIKNTEPLLK